MDVKDYLVYFLIHNLECKCLGHMLSPLFLDLFCELVQPRLLQIKTFKRSHDVRSRPADHEGPVRWSCDLCDIINAEGNPELTHADPVLQFKSCC